MPKLDEIPGKTLGGCSVESLIAKGGMSATFRAHHQALDIAVVVKVLDPRRSHSHRGLVQRFLEEGRSLAKVHHPGVVRVFSAGEELQTPFIILELVEGNTLRACLRDGSLMWEALVERLIQVADGLGAVHGEGLIHRDVKPENVMVTDEGAKLVDFGIAVPSGAADLVTVVGTPAYMSPEAAVARPLDARSDVYSFGVMLYECLCDRWPFNAPEPKRLLKKHVNEQPPLDPLHEADVPQPVIDLIERCLAKKPSERPRNGVELSGELKDAFGIGGESKKEPRARRRKRRLGRRSSSSATGAAIATSGSRGAVRRRSSSGAPVVFGILFFAAIAVGAIYALTQM